MQSSKECFWTQVREYEPPGGRDYVIHTVNGEMARKLGMTPVQMAEDIQSDGLYVPDKYAMLTYYFSADWIRDQDGQVVDLVFFTDTKPTEENIGVMRDSATAGYPLRDPVGRIMPVADVPERVSEIFPDAQAFLRVPPDDLVAVAVWDTPSRMRTAEMVQNIVYATASGNISVDEGIRGIAGLLKNGPFCFVNGKAPDTVLAEIAGNCINVGLRRRKYQELFSAYAGFH
ncbi:hypothetical protein A2Z33_05695 [Candidatus Gottesmanbacteria bacterium RBG_16_52_11]|uniref:Uncharacterized protein n=1 Tax=Candidatus Gottesmanbacteria bacterium RBG_16_52_11 TaxID=1798374 RepID=A0A1F5YXT3_9BACT|nr:MAG: hypothetical protein A2Z33_05695 [Candidatus Gottesmanbacteria bacterium RBG_16_52_11]